MLGHVCCFRLQVRVRNYDLVGAEVQGVFHALIGPNQVRSEKGPFRIRWVGAGVTREPATSVRTSLRILVRCPEVLRLEEVTGLILGNVVAAIALVPLAIIPRVIAVVRFTRPQAACGAMRLASSAVA